jgi:hypoxanthine phosphoribosyltransferase
MHKRTISWTEYQGLVGKIARDISVSGWRPDYIVGITRGGALPAVMLSHYLDVPMFPLAVSLRDHENTESNCWMAEDAYGLVGRYEEHPVVDENYGRKNILIVDDMNDSGATLNWIMEDWAASCFPQSSSWAQIWGNNVRFAVLFDNLGSQCNLKMNYVGEEINKAENDVWIDFPYEDWWTK